MQWGGQIFYYVKLTYPFMSGIMKNTHIKYLLKDGNKFLGNFQ